jgi:ATP-dependent Clp protease ATP-binding subunit ClpA
VPGKIDPLIGREQGTRARDPDLCRRRKNNPLLVGEAGVGKTAIAEGLAKRIVDGDVPEMLPTAQVYASTWARCSPAPSTAATSSSA